MAERNPEQSAQRTADLARHLVEHPLDGVQVGKRFSKQQGIPGKGHVDFRHDAAERHSRAVNFMLISGQ